METTQKDANLLAMCVDVQSDDNTHRFADELRQTQRHLARRLRHADLEPRIPFATLLLEIMLDGDDVLRLIWRSVLSKEGLDVVECAECADGIIVNAEQRDDVTLCSVCEHGRIEPLE